MKSPDSRFGSCRFTRAVTVNSNRHRSYCPGVVVERKRDPGEYAEEPPEILELAEIDPLRVEVYAPVRLLGRISVGSRARVVSEVGDEQEARVVVVDRVVDAASGTFGVQLEFPNPALEVAAGLKCSVRFEDGEVAVTAP